MNRLPEKTTDKNMMHRPACIAPAPLYAMHYVKNELCLPADEAPKTEKLREKRKNNVEFYQTKPPSSTTSSRLFKVHATRALQSLKYGEKLFVNYGNNYEFN